MDVGDKVKAAADIKTVAKTFGASVVGITAYDERWHYTTKFGRNRGQDYPNDLLESEKDASLPNAIVIGTAMDQTLMETVPSALSGAAVGMGYSRDALSLLTVAQYIVSEWPPPQK